MIISILYGVTGIGLLLWSFKFLFTKSFFPYHSEAVDQKWEEIPKNIQYLILILMRVIGVALTLISILVIYGAIILYRIPLTEVKVVVPLTIVFLLSSLFMITYNVHKNTRANTPWKAALVWSLLNVLTTIYSFI